MRVGALSRAGICGSAGKGGYGVFGSVDRSSTLLGELKFHREAVKAEHTFEIDFAIRVLRSAALEELFVWVRGLVRRVPCIPAATEGSQDGLRTLSCG